MCLYLCEYPSHTDPFFFCYSNLCLIYKLLCIYINFFCFINSVRFFVAVDVFALNRKLFAKLNCAEVLGTFEQSVSLNRLYVYEHFLKCYSVCSNVCNVCVSLVLS